MNYPHQKDHDNDVNEIRLQLMNQNQEEEIQKENDWLSNQFSRFPFIFYRFWLVLTFLITLSIQPDLILCQFEDLHEELRMRLAHVNISSILVFIGCGEMLFGIMKRKSALTEKGLIKFQFSIIGAIFAWAVRNQLHLDSPKFFLFEQVLKIAFPLSILGSVFGGLSVVRAFKESHRLARLEGLHDNPDFFDQNGVLAVEISKYDQQLDRWPYKIYRFWLKFVIVIEILMISPIIFSWKEIRRSNVFMFILHSLLAFCCFEMEAVLRTKILKKSKKALLHLKICIFVSFILLTIMAIFPEENLIAGYVWVGIGMLCISPLITLIGALNINKILEQRDKFVKASSYSDDHYH